VRQVLHLFAESVGESGESAHTYPHGEVLALHIRRGRLVEVGVAIDLPNVDPGADSGAVAARIVESGWGRIDYIASN
jgi:hypothetical protein